MSEGFPPAWQYDVSNTDGHASSTGTANPATTGFGDDGATAAEFAQPEVAQPEVAQPEVVQPQVVQPEVVQPEVVQAQFSQPEYYATTADSGAEPGKADAAKEQAAAVGQGAAQAGQQVASVAKDQAQSVVAEAGSQAKDLISQARSELTDQAAVQQSRLASGLRALGDELESMTHHSEQPGVATELAKQAATRSHDVASWLDDREPGHLLEEIQSFARQRPAAFLALAAGAGLVAGRLGRGVKDATGGDPAPTDRVSAQVDAPAGDAVNQVRPFASSQDASGDVRGVGEFR